MFWGLVAFVVVATVFAMSVTHRLEVFCADWFKRLRPHAAMVARVTLGLCLVASASNHALFGPELPLSTLEGGSKIIEILMYTAGILLVLGVYTRVAAALTLLVIAAGVVVHGWYMLTYTNYLGEALLALFLLPRSVKWEALAFLLLRVSFGVSVAFGALYAKFLHSNLALSTIAQYNLTNYFPFDPLFIVLGACIIEVLMGIFFIIGFEIRHTALFFMFWITLSLFYFGEAVWPHLILVGVNAALFMYGYDKYTLHGRLFNRGHLQPVL